MSYRGPQDYNNLHYPYYDQQNATHAQPVTATTTTPQPRHFNTSHYPQDRPIVYPDYHYQPPPAPVAAAAPPTAYPYQHTHHLEPYVPTPQPVYQAYPTPPASFNPAHGYYPQQHYLAPPQAYASPVPTPSPVPAYHQVSGSPAFPAPVPAPAPVTVTALRTQPPVDVAVNFSAPTPAEPPLAHPAPPSTRKIKLKVPDQAQPLTTTSAMPARSNRNADDEWAPGPRPTRGGRRPRYNVDDASEEEFDDRTGTEEEVDDEGAYEQPVPTSRPQRIKLKTTRYDPAPDVKPARTSLDRNGGGGSRRTSRSHPDALPVEEVPEDTPPRPRRGFPPRDTAPANAEPPTLDGLFDDNEDNGPPTEATPTPRKPAGRGRSRQSSEGSFNPDESDDQSEETESDDPIANDHIHSLDDDDDDDEADYNDRPRRRKQAQTNRRAPPPRAPQRRSQRARRAAFEEDDDVPVQKKLRARKAKVDYTLPPADISAEILQNAIASASRPGGRPAGVGRAGGVRFGGASVAGGKGLPWSARGRDLAHAMGDPDTSDSDDLMPPMKGSGAGPSSIPAGGAGRAGQTDVANFGRINPKSSTADADPLGVDMNVTFDNVGGLDTHINQLKEMVALPLLYPELFQQFGITPPRGVLFHGPPGTGKTLLARALAASCSTGNTKIAFFMRKGADVLSKWVGEAERQLRMLFEEARAAQPSIIFFDEIDGLAPVRSSKQDQIHASLVSTLLALMDGMDGRGQVIVIGATNRPDAVDPALRRPGRFDREFYFPLPNKEARKKIIGINTRKWDPQLSDPVLDQLAGLTKGYGGADLRALCTEAALNAIQRRYPQIYKTSDRLLLQPSSIQVQAKDFMMSVKKIVPSSARSTASAAAPLPAHLLPLLSSSLDKLKQVVDNALPAKRNTTALEEAEFEEDERDSFAKHSMLQSLDKMRTYRPRILVHGPAGMGQAWLGPAILHHLEGFHVQTLDLGTLMGDSARTVEAALVQLFVEAKRHQPSVIFIPSLSQWASAISDTARSTIRALLDGIPASDPILVLALVDGGLIDLPRDIKAWFGLGLDNRVELTTPASDERRAYFADLIKTINMPPTEFPDALPRRRRVLEILPAAPPLPPRAKTEAEIAKEVEKDVQAREMMIISFTGLVQDFMRKFRKVTATVREDAMELTAVLQSQQDAEVEQSTAQADDALTVPPAGQVGLVNGDGAHVSIYTESSLPIPPMSQEASQLPDAAEPAAEVAPLATGEDEPVAAATAPAKPPVWQAHNLDIDIVSLKLSKHKYLTPSDFLADISKIEENADKLGDPDRIARIGEMGAHARMHVMNFDPAWEPRFEAYAERVRERKAKRQKEKEDKKRSEAEVGVESAAAQVPNGNGNAEGEGSLKRTREGGDEADIDAPRGEKRMREDIDVVMEDSTLSSLTETPVSSAPPTQPEQQQGQQKITVPPPRVVYPDFTVPQAALQALETSLVFGTNEFNVEQLEQLRAACFDKIWRHRAEWDRTACVHEVHQTCNQLVDQVSELAAKEEDEF